jgi:hypothetical protein
LLACKRSSEGEAIILRFQEPVGENREATIRQSRPEREIRLVFAPFEIKTVRIERDGSWREVDMIDEV